MKKKETVRSVEARNKLISPLLEVGSDWVAAFCKRKYGKYVNQFTMEEIISIGYEALVVSADVWVPRSTIGKADVHSPVDLINLDTATIEEIRTYASTEGFFIYSQNRVRAAIRRHLLNKDSPMFVPEYSRRQENFNPPKSISLESLEWDVNVDPMTPEDLLIRKRTLVLLAEFMQENLSKAENYVIGRLNGFLGEQTPTFEELGLELGMSRQAVNEKYHRSLKKLRTLLEEEEE